MSKKKLMVANFNVTFGEKEEPLLNYFDEIIYPALTSGIIREKKDDEYFLDNVQLLEYQKDEFILAGQFIKNTKVEVKSKYIENKGLIQTDESYPSAPYSIFIVFLRNHRAVIVKNQKDSPDIRSFNASIRYILKQYTSEKNQGVEKERKLPYAIVDIISLPSKKGIIEVLKNVREIRKLTLKFYPLNGDIPINDAFEAITDELNQIGSKTGHVIYNTPTNKVGIAELIAETRGTVDPTLNVVYQNGASGRLDNDSFTEIYEIDVSDEIGYNSNVREVAKIAKSLDEIKETSRENEQIYKKALNKLKKHVK